MVWISQILLFERREDTPIHQALSGVSTELRIIPNAVPWGLITMCLELERKM